MIMENNVVIHKKKFNSKDCIELILLFASLVFFFCFKQYIVTFFYGLFVLYYVKRIFERVNDKTSMIEFSKYSLRILGKIDFHKEPVNFTFLWQNVTNIELIYVNSYDAGWRLSIYLDEDCEYFNINTFDFDPIYLKRTFDKYSLCNTKFTKRKGCLNLNWSKYEKANQGVYD